jgi:hypothetical protein
MDIAWGVVILVLGLLAWGGQVLAWLAPRRAARLGLVEAEASVEPVFWADIRGEALWDSLSLWTLAAAGLLLVIGEPAWAYLGLIGGGMYVYFGGRGILTRLMLRRGDFRIGEPGSVRIGLLMLGVWSVAGAITTVASIGGLTWT